MASVVQTRGGYNGATGTSISLAYDSNLASGNLIVGVMLYTDPAVTPSFSDTQGNTWTLDANVQKAPPGQASAIAHALAKSGANTVTADRGDAGNQPISLVLFEVNGLANSVSTAVSSGTGTTQGSGETNSISFGSPNFIVGGISIYNPNNGTITVGANFTMFAVSGPAPVSGFVAEYSVGSVTSPTTFPWTLSANAGNWAEAGAAFTNAVVAAFMESGSKRRYRRGFSKR